MKALFFWVLLVMPSFAADDIFRGRLLNPNSLRGQGEQAPRLYDARQRGLVPTSGAYLPDRVYSVFHQGEKKWVYSQTTHWGKFSEPFEFFYPGSVVQGKFLGSDFPNENYTLNKKFEWELTRSPFRKQLLLVLAEPPFFKRVNWYRTEKKAK